MAAGFDAGSMDALVRHEDLKVEGRRIKSAEELSLIEARCQIQLFDHREAEKVHVETEHGEVVVVVLGDRQKPAAVTYHDVGANYATCFGGFLQDPSMSDIAHHFCWYHINASGQHVGASDWMESSYPTVTQQAEQVHSVVKHFGLAHCVGIGVGLGANVLARFAMMHKGVVTGLALVQLAPFQPTPSTTSWISSKIAKWKVKQGQLRSTLLDSLAEKIGAFGDEASMFQVYKDGLLLQNTHNLLCLMEQYHSRSSIADEMGVLLDCRCFFVSARGSRQAKEVEAVVPGMDPSKVSSMSVEWSGTQPLLEEHPLKMATALRLFLQGLGYVSSLGLLEPKLLSTSGSKELLRQTSIIECGRDIFQGED